MRFSKSWLLIILIILLATTAHAYRESESTTTAARDADARPAAIARFEGSLVCKMGAENTGQPCELKLIERKSGKTYLLVNADRAMRLLNDGARNVMIEGNSLGDEAIEVRKAEALAARELQSYFLECMLKLDKDKYRRIAREKNVNEALTALHLDTAQLEYQTFEGQHGWQPENWDYLEGIRAFSRELWAEALPKK